MFGRKELKAEIENLRAEIRFYKTDEQKWREAVNDTQALHRHNGELATETNKLKSQVREQTEADLLFTSLKICFELLKGKPKKEVKTLLQQQAQMQAMLARQQAAMPSSLPYLPYGESIFGGLFR